MQSGSGQWRKTVNENRLPAELAELRRRLGQGKPSLLVIVCIGTDRSTGDAFGPLTGTLLVEAGFAHVIGTLENPCDSYNLTDKLLRVPADASVMAIDASVGAPLQVGGFTLADGPVQPGRSLGKRLPLVGSCSITGIVCENRANPYAALQTTSLYLVMTMARQLTAAMTEVFFQAIDSG